ncbi:MAG: acyl carrier protein [Acidimicrobiales bacterium]
MAAIAQTGGSLVLDFEQFSGRLLRSLRIPEPEEGVNSTTSLFDDLGLDSIQAFEMILITEELAETLIPPAEMPAMYTLGDVFAYYRVAAEMSRDERA